MFVRNSQPLNLGTVALGAESSLAGELSSLRRLFLLDSAPGCGKSTVLDHVAQRYEPSEASIFPKYRTGGRAGRSTLEYVSLSEEEFRSHAEHSEFWHYRYSKDQFGFYRRDLEAAIASSRNTVVLIRSASMIRRLVAEITSAQVVPIFLTASPSVIAERILAEGATSEVIAHRLARTTELLDDYESSLYAHRVANNGTREELEQAIDTLLKSAQRLAA